METRGDVAGTRSAGAAMNGAQAMTLYLTGFVRQLASAGVRHAVICPGSRSTPLALLLWQSPIQCLMHLDERSAGYFALGIAKSSGRPVAVLTTSGTAVANLLPSVAEAYLSRVPLVVLTADRPPELRQQGAPQTIDQVGVFGTHVKWFQDMPVADSHPDLLRFAPIVAERAVRLSATAPAGPVHVNFPLREPLLPEPWTPALEHLLPAVPVAVHASTKTPDKDVLARLAHDLRAGARGLIVAGPGDWRREADSILELARTLGWPVAADPLSNLRPLAAPVVGRYDLFLRHDKTRRLLAPDWVIRLGMPPTSKILNQTIAHTRTIVLDVDGGWREPLLTGAQMIYGEPALSLDALIQLSSGSVIADNWQSRWAAAERAADRLLADRLASLEPPSESALFYHLGDWTKNAPPTTVVVASSMPVRDLDTFYPPGPIRLTWAANRGANGIDGVLSTALGVAAVEGRVIAIVGDIACYHDMNGLLAAKLHQLNALIIVINNDGGGIFSFLPQAALPPEEFETLFGTPHGLEFSGVSALYGAVYRAVDNLDELGRAVAAWAADPGFHLVEWRAPGRQRNAALHRALFDALNEALEAPDALL